MATISSNSTNFRLRVVLNHLQQPVMKNTAAVKYKFTLDNKLLSDEQRKFYEANGFLVIRKLIDDGLLDECKQRFVDLCNGTVSKGNMTLMKDKSLRGTGVKGEYLYNKVQDIIWDEVLSKYIMHPTVLDYVECFTGPNVQAVHSMLINKPPDSGSNTSQHPMHQDLHYFPFRPAERIVATWTAMERITEDNGCLFVIPGTHKAALQPHDYPQDDVNKAYHGLLGFENIPKTNLVMEKGDTVFFHPCLFHGSYPNHTKGFRKAISCHYASSDCYFIEVKGTTQENIGKEVEGMGKSKFGIELDFADIWRLRKRLCRGYEGTLS